MEGEGQLLTERVQLGRDRLDAGAETLRDGVRCWRCKSRWREARVSMASVLSYYHSL
jgi:hypothetical protein